MLIKAKIILGIILGLLVLSVVIVVVERGLGEAPTAETKQTTNVENKIPTTEMFVGDAQVKVGVANSPAEWRKGLSDRPSLKSGNGLLFIYPEEGRPGIWMKDMNFAIDIIWISSDGRVVDIKKNATPDTYPETTFYPEHEARYALEVPAGFTSDNKISKGTRVRLPNQ